MTARAIFVSLLFLGMGLAGCIGGPSEEPELEGATNETDFNKANPNAGQTLVAFEETNKTEEGSGGVDHHHDLWNGQSRVVIFEEKRQMAPFPNDQNEATAVFRPPQGALIYEGTATVEFTIKDPERRACEPLVTLGGDFVCTDNALKAGASFVGVEPPADGVPRTADPTGGTPGMTLRYKHASTTQWIDVGALAWGVPSVIKISDALHTDMPHATSSLWEFQVISPAAVDSTLTFTAKAEMVRGEGDIPLWPGHPDFYAERTSREVLTVVGAEACDGAGGCALATDAAGPIHAQKLISYGTKTMHVWVNITDATFPSPATAPSNWFLFHLNATGRDNLTNPFDADAPITKREFYWIFPVDDNGMDSPYADGSRWTFELGGSLTTPILSCYAGCADWFAKYDIVVHATNEELPFDAYHYSCLRDEECPEPTA